MNEPKGEAVALVEQLDQFVGEALDNEAKVWDLAYSGADRLEAATSAARTAVLAAFAEHPELLRAVPGIEVEWGVHSPDLEAMSGVTPYVLSTDTEAEARQWGRGLDEEFPGERHDPVRRLVTTWRAAATEEAGPS